LLQAELEKHLRASDYSENASSNDGMHRKLPRRPPEWWNWLGSFLRTFAYGHSDDLGYDNPDRPVRPRLLLSDKIC
jgi:hypothetical protein